MGLYDQYIPEPDLLCPRCGVTMEYWTGRDGPCRLLVWRQGAIGPDGYQSAVDDMARLPAEEVAVFRLPSRFVIGGGECQCSSAYAALGTVDAEGRWVSTQIITSDEARAFYNPLWNT